MGSFDPFFVGLNLAQGIGIRCKLIYIGFEGGFLAQLVIERSIFHCLDSSPGHSGRQFLKGIRWWFDDYCLL